jgi:O-antigen ligase
MPFYPFYYFVFKELITSKILTYYFILMLPIIILQYFLNEQYLINELDKDIVVNNLAYAFVSLIPFTFLFKKKILAYGAILILFYFIISSSKRGAIITGSAGLIFFMYNQIRTLKIKNRWKGYLISLLSFFVLIYFIFNFLEANELLTERIEHMREGDSSGRDIIYTNIFNNWYNDNSIIHFLFGYGFASSIELSGFGILAHNDWLELLSNFGLLGICVYLFFFYSGFSSIKNNTWDVNRKITMLATLSMWLLTSFFSMGYSSDIGFFRVVLIAYLIGFSENNNKFRKNENSLFYR